MLNDSGWMQVLSKVLRPAFGLALFLSQFTATRDTLFTESGPVYRTYQQRTGMFFPKVQLK